MYYSFAIHLTSLNHLKSFDSTSELSSARVCIKEYRRREEHLDGG